MYLQSLGFNVQLKPIQSIQPAFGVSTIPMPQSFLKEWMLRLLEPTKATRPAEFTVSRQDTNFKVEDTHVSAEHAIITMQPNGDCTIKDNKSTWGTFITRSNSCYFNHSIKGQGEFALQPGDIIKVGETRLKFPEVPDTIKQFDGKTYGAIYQTKDASKFSKAINFHLCTLRPDQRIDIKRVKKNETEKLWHLDRVSIVSVPTPSKKTLISLTKNDSDKKVTITQVREKKAENPPPTFPAKPDKLKSFVSESGKAFNIKFSETDQLAVRLLYF